jgi:hypothetical protein
MHPTKIKLDTTVSEFLSSVVTMLRHSLHLLTIQSLILPAESVLPPLVTNVLEVKSKS